MKEEICKSCEKLKKEIKGWEETCEILVDNKLMRNLVKSFEGIKKPSQKSIPYDKFMGWLKELDKEKRLLSKSENNSDLESKFYNNGVINTIFSIIEEIKQKWGRK